MYFQLITVTNKDVTVMYSILRPLHMLMFSLTYKVHKLKLKKDQITLSDTVKFLINGSRIQKSIASV
jgi:hypothetical protein